MYRSIRVHEPRRPHGAASHQLPQIRARPGAVELPARRRHQQGVHGGEPVLGVPRAEPVRHGQVHRITGLAARFGGRGQDPRVAPGVVDGDRRQFAKQGRQ